MSKHPIWSTSLQISCGFPPAATAGTKRPRPPASTVWPPKAWICVTRCPAIRYALPTALPCFTGKYTTSTGMVINEIRMNPDHRCIAHELHDGGYETAYIGKWHLYANEWGNHEDPKNSYIPAGPDRLGFDDFFAAYNFHHEYYKPHAYYHLNSPEKIFFDKYEPDGQTDLAIEQLERLSEKKSPSPCSCHWARLTTPGCRKMFRRSIWKNLRTWSFPSPPTICRITDPHADDWAKLSEKSVPNSPSRFGFITP